MDEKNKKNESYLFLIIILFLMIVLFLMVFNGYHHYSEQELNSEPENISDEIQLCKFACYPDAYAYDPCQDKCLCEGD